MAVINKIQISGQTYTIDGGGDEHYKSEIDTNISYDAPVITVSNGKKEITERNLNNYLSEDLYNMVWLDVTSSFETTEPRKLFALNNSGKIYFYDNGSMLEKTVCEYNPSTKRYEFDSNVYMYEGFDGQIWYAGDRVIKQYGNGNFENGAYIEAATNWDDGEELRIVNQSDFYANGWTAQGGFRFVYMRDRYYEITSETAMTDTIKVDYMGNKYHIVPKELIKTVNGQSLIGTGNLTVTADYPKYSGQTSISTSDYFVVRGGKLNEFNYAYNWVDSNGANTKVLIDRYKYSSGNTTPAHTGNTLAIIDKENKTNISLIQSNVEFNQIVEYTQFKMKVNKPSDLENNGALYQYSYTGEYLDILYTSNGKVYFNQNARTDSYGIAFLLQFFNTENNSWEYAPTTQTTFNGYVGYELEEDKIYQLIAYPDYGSYDTSYLLENKSGTVYFDIYKVLLTANTDASNSLYMLDNNQKLRVLTEKDLGGVTGGGSSNIVSISQQDYDELQTKDDDTLYVINDAEEVDASDFATKDDLNKKQDKMTNNYLSKVDVGGSSISIETKSFNGEIVQKTDTINFKTINGNPIFGMGDINDLAPKSDLGGLKLVKISQTEYDKLGTKDNNTLYVIVD